MPRSSSRSSSSSRSPARAAPARAAAPSSTAPVAHSAPASAVGAPRQEGGGLMGSMIQGFAMGTGSAIAHRAVGAVFGSMGGGSSAPAPAGEAPVAAAAPAAANSKCDTHNTEFVRCVKENKHDIASCQMYMDNFNQCLTDQRLH